MLMSPFWILKLPILIVTVAALESASAANTTNILGRCPPLEKWNACPEGAISCADDNGCSDSEKCCPSACGSVCIKPLFTSCEHYRDSAVRRARVLGSTKDVRVPRCSPEGSWEPVQCAENGPCWCVDPSGAEIPGTAAPLKEDVNCTAPIDKCPAHSCRMLCPLGFALDPITGCPHCSCRDPCQGVKCPGGQQCHLQEVACLTQPCPPVPTCKRARSLGDLCPLGSPLAISDTQRPFLCGTDPGKPDCPPLYRCLVQHGNDYGVCCPASPQLEKAGSCPAVVDTTNTEVSRISEICGSSCEYDLECPVNLKCCKSQNCGRHCIQPQNVTNCLQQRMLSELLIVSEREGRGYIPQCDAPGGHFSNRQCSRNGLVCWCVESRSGNKVPGTMGAASTVNCTNQDYHAVGRSLDTKQCDLNICAAVCEYGFKSDDSGCPTCECENPCVGYKCREGEICEVARDQQCEQNGALTLCESQPICRPNIAYSNPCAAGTPLTNTTNGELLRCSASELCPHSHSCNTLKIGSPQGVCCPVTQDLGLDMILEEDRPQSMCEYLRDFNNRMEGTVEGLELALIPPRCNPDGNYAPAQCDATQNVCWCVDNYGTEIPKTRGGQDVSIEHCQSVRDALGCLDLTCRMGCDYGFYLDVDTSCPTCQCRDPCQGIACPSGQQCTAIEVACGNEYCPPVPACLPRKEGQCPFLIPPGGGVSGDCVMECSSDSQCPGSKRCCATGCGTQCVMPDMRTACQHQQAIQKHQAHESGIPARQLYIVECAVDGSFKEVQCGPPVGQNGTQGIRSCWCVDHQTGSELPGTRVKDGAVPNCEAPRECPLYKCSQNCDYGYQFDSNGCRTCQCLDPCANITCKNQGESCRLVEVQCSNGPCPPVAVCMPHEENMCQSGPPLIQGGVEVQCGPQGGACPSTHECQISPLEDKAVCCPKPRDVCWERLEEGACPEGSANSIVPVQRWYFSPVNNKCESFLWAGCSANHNHFQNLQACEAVCPVLSQCERLREKNKKAAERYRKSTFTPKCDTESGAWSPSQCLGVIDEAPGNKGALCWCVDPKGTLLKGTLTRGQEPECNYRQARGRKITKDEDKVMEELIRQLTAFDFVESVELMGKTEVPMISRRISDITDIKFSPPEPHSQGVNAKPVTSLPKPQINSLQDLSLQSSESSFQINPINHEEKVESRVKKVLKMDAPEYSTSSNYYEESFIKKVDDKIVNHSKKKVLKEPYFEKEITHNTKKRRCEAFRASPAAPFPVQCDEQGLFVPTQCNGMNCWCVDEAGNQLPNSETFTKGSKDCVMTPIKAVEVELGLLGNLSGEIPVGLSQQLFALVKNLGGSVTDEGPLKANTHSEGVTLHFQIVGDNKVDVAYQLEEMVKTRQLAISPDPDTPELAPLIGDITRSRFRHLSSPEEERIIQELRSADSSARSSERLNEELSVSPLQTAVFVLATASAFLVGVFVVFIMLYRGKMARNVDNPSPKTTDLGERFLAYSSPVYVLSPTEIQQPQKALV